MCKTLCYSTVGFGACALVAQSRCPLPSHSVVRIHKCMRAVVQVMRAFCEEWEALLGVTITLSKEDEPLGTAGPLALARDKLDDGTGEPFFVLNSDVICAYPLADMMAHHKRKGAEATLLITKARAHPCGHSAHARTPLCMRGMPCKLRVWLPWALCCCRCYWSQHARATAVHTYTRGRRVIMGAVQAILCGPQCCTVVGCGAYNSSSGVPCRWKTPASMA